QQVGSSQAREQMNTQTLVFAFSVLRGIDEAQTDSSLTMVVERLNQWSQKKSPIPDWKPDPLLHDLPEELRDLFAVVHLADLKFPLGDGHELQQAVWLNEIASRA